MSNYIVEAFKAMSLLESEDISLNADGVEELSGFMAEAGVDPDEEIIDVYDTETTDEDELKNSYIGKVVLECSVCHSDIFVDKSEISVDTDEEGLACHDIECPYCMSNEGYTIIGEVAPYNEAESEKLLADEEELPEVDAEGAADSIEEEDLEEGLLTGDINIGNGNSLASGNSFDLDANGNDVSVGAKLGESTEPELKGDGKEELYDNQDLRGADELKGVDKLEGSDDIRGPIHKKHINEDIDFSGGTELTRRGGVVWYEFYDDEYDRTYYGAKSNDNVIEAYIWPVQDSFDIEVEANGDIIVSKRLHLKDADAAMNYVEDVVREYILNEYDEYLTEDINDINVSTDDENITVSQKEDGGVVVETSPNEDFGEFGAETPDLAGGEEMIAPISDDSLDEIEAAADANSVEEGEEDLEYSELANEEAPGDDFEFEDFDEESFNGLGESYLKSCYENVTGFKTTGISLDGPKLMIEGIIKFDSGNIKETEFIFESTEAGKYAGYNKQISRGNKSFKLNTSVINRKLVCESLNYNYRSRNELNESVRVYGTVKRK